uniref:SWIM-type domain-containing protein n=1 Tax=Amphimedon queenslandica TaxID=400682 RepID=A0A1X7TT93_AMPQE
MKSLKAYKFFYNGFVQNVWVHECSPTGGTVVLRVLYFHAYVHLSFTCESPLLVFVSINGDNRDVYAAKCNCVSGLGQACNYVAALFFFIEHYVSTGQECLPTKVSKTSKPMAWN